MLIYFVLFSFCIFFSCVAGIAPKPRLKLVSVLVIVLAFSLIGGARDKGVGTDTEFYIDYYFQMAQTWGFSWDIFQTDDIIHDRGFTILTYLSTLITDDVRIAYLFYQLFSIGLIFWGVYKLNDHYKISIPIFTILFCFIIYNQTYNYMRQFCAMGLLIPAFYYILQWKWGKYLILQFLAFHFHSTSLLFVLVPIFYIICKSKSKLLQYSTLGFLVLSLLLASSFFFEILEIALQSGLTSEMYADRYGEASQYEASGTLPKSSFVIYAYPFFLIIILKLKKSITNEIALFAGLIHLSFVSIQSLSFIIYTLYRLSLYFYMIDIVILSYLLNKKGILTIINYLFYCMLIYNWYLLYIIQNSCETYPYKSHLLGII